MEKKIKGRRWFSHTGYQEAQQMKLQDDKREYSLVIYYPPWHN